jgi:hypothetical protein
MGRVYLAIKFNSWAAAIPSKLGFQRSNQNHRWINHEDGGCF